MDSDGIEKRRTGKIEKAPIFRTRDTNEWTCLVSGVALFGANDRQIYDEFLDASNRQVPVERVLQYDCRTAGHDPELGGCGSDGSHFPQFRSQTGAKIPRGDTCARGSLSPSATGHNSLAHVCGGALILRGDRPLWLSGPFLGHAERVSFRLRHRDRLRLDQFRWEPRRVCGPFDGWVYESKNRQYL